MYIIIIIIVNVESLGKPKDVPEDAVTTPGPSGSGLEPSPIGLLSTPPPPPAHPTPLYIYIYTPPLKRKEELHPSELLTMCRMFVGMPLEFTAHNYDRQAV